MSSWIRATTSTPSAPRSSTSVLSSNLMSLSEYATTTLDIFLSVASFSIFLNPFLSSLRLLPILVRNSYFVTLFCLSRSLNALIYLSRSSHRVCDEALAYKTTVFGLTIPISFLTSSSLNLHLPLSRIAGLIQPFFTYSLRVV